MRRVAGIFVGGRASRMGGVAKGLLVAPDGEPIVPRTQRLFEAAGASCVLVGDHPAYRDLGLPVLVDDPEASGPLAGIIALLAAVPDGHAVAVACDMPFLTPAFVRRLFDAPAAPIIAPRRHDPERGWVWEPLFARYEVSTMLPLAREFARSGRRKLQHLLDTAGAQALELEEGELELLTDWDRPEDKRPAC